MLFDAPYIPLLDGAPNDGSAWVDPDRPTLADVWKAAGNGALRDGLVEGDRRVVRGGSCLSYYTECRSACRVGGFFLYPNVGFRVSADIPLELPAVPVE